MGENSPRNVVMEMIWLFLFFQKKKNILEEYRWNLLVHYFLVALYCCLCVSISLDKEYVLVCFIEEI